MGASKTEHFSVEQNAMSAMAKALGHPARVAIMEYLARVNACICGDIVNELPLAQPTVSQHLKELKSAGLIKGSIEGNAICYCIDLENFKKFQDYLNRVVSQIHNSSSCC